MSSKNDRRRIRETIKNPSIYTWERHLEECSKRKDARGGFRFKPLKIHFVDDQCIRTCSIVLNVPISTKNIVKKSNLGYALRDILRELSTFFLKEDGRIKYNLEFGSTRFPQVLYSTSNLKDKPELEEAVDIIIKESQPLLAKIEFALSKLGIELQVIKSREAGRAALTIPGNYKLESNNFRFVEAGSIIIKEKEVFLNRKMGDTGRIKMVPIKKKLINAKKTQPILFDKDTLEDVLRTIKAINAGAGMLIGKNERKEGSSCRISLKDRRSKIGIQA